MFSLWTSLPESWPTHRQPACSGPQPSSRRVTTGLVLGPSGSHPSGDGRIEKGAGPASSKPESMADRRPSPCLARSPARPGLFPAFLTAQLCPPVLLLDHQLQPGCVTLRPCDAGDKHAYPNDARPQTTPHCTWPGEEHPQRQGVGTPCRDLDPYGQSPCLPSFCDYLETVPSNRHHHPPPHPQH